MSSNKKYVNHSLKGFSILSLLLGSILVLGCATSEDKTENDISDSVENEVTSDDDLPRPKSSKTIQFGSTLVTSISNNRLTSRTVDKKNASDLARSLKGKNLNDLQDSVYAERLSARGVNAVLSKAQKMMDKLFTKGIKQDLPETVKLEIALAAVQVTNVSLANIFLQDIIKGSKNAKLKAAAYNAKGVLFLKMNEIPDAALSFKQALKLSPNYPAAIFNLGMLTLKYGDFGTARRYLTQIQSDWYAKIGLVVAERNLMNNSRVQSLCDQLMRSKGEHKMVLYNCGLYFAQNKGDKKKGVELITRATKIPGGETNWDEKAFKLLEKLR